MVKHVGDTTGVVVAPSDIAGSTALHRLEFLFCSLCVAITVKAGLLKLLLGRSVTVTVTVSLTVTVSVTVTVCECHV